MNTLCKMVRNTEKAESEVDEYIALCRALDNSLVIKYLQELHDSTFDANVRVKLSAIIKHIGVHRE